MNDAKLFDDSVSDFTATQTSKVLSEYIKSMSWNRGDRVLDLGCGPGTVTTQVLMPRLPEDFDLLVGADLRATMLQYARERYTHPKLRFTQFDIVEDIGNTSQLRPSEFDKIFSFFLLHCVQDHRKALKNMYSLLRNGGESLIIFFGTHAMFKIFEIQSQKPEWQPYTKDIHHYVAPYQHSSDPAGEFSKLLQDTGFEVISSEFRDGEYIFEPLSRFTDAVKALDPILDRIPRELHEQYMTQFMTEYMKTTETNKTTDEGVLFKYGLIVAFARKS